MNALRALSTIVGVTVALFGLLFLLERLEDLAKQEVRHAIERLNLQSVLEASPSAHRPVADPGAEVAGRTARPAELAVDTGGSATPATGRSSNPSGWSGGLAP